MRQRVFEVLTLSCLAACADASSAMSKSDESGAFGPAASDSDGSVGAGGQGAGRPDENETERLTFGKPAVGRDHVWVASPENDLVLRIDGTDRSVRTVAVGDGPSRVVTRPGEEFGVVLNRGSDSLTVIDARSDEASTTDFALSRHFNALAMHPDGRFVITWFELDEAEPGEDSTALQDAAVLDLMSGQVVPISTGFRPRAPFFPTGPDGAASAYLVTDDGLTVVELDHLDRAPRLLPTATDPFAQSGREVHITVDGALVVSRGRDETALTVLSPSDGVLRSIELGAVPTDLDLLADGVHALAMLRERQEAVMVNLLDESLLRYALPAPLGAAAVSHTGSRALLYTTLSAQELAPRIAVLDLSVDPPTLSERPVRKEIAGAVIDPEGATAFVLHRKAEGEPDPAQGETAFLERSYGYSLVDLDTLFVRLVTTPAEPSGLLYSDDGLRAFVPLSRPDRATYALQILELGPLSVRTVTLPSAPEQLGELAAVERVFVTQTHREGRISFLDAAREDASLETVSGYLLNGRIE